MIKRRRESTQNRRQTGTQSDMLQFQKKATESSIAKIKIRERIL